MGPINICASETYSVNVPAGTTVSLSAVSFPKLNSITSTTSGNQITVNRVGTNVGTVTITAVVTTICGSFTVTREVYLGPIPASIIGPYDPIEHTPMGVACVGQEYYFAPLPVDATATYLWTLTPPIGSVEPTYIFTGTQPYMTFNEVGCYNLSVAKTNSCGTVTTNRTICTEECFQALKISVSPNPAQSEITVTFADSDKHKIKSNARVHIEIYNANTGIKQKQWTFNGTNNNFKLNVSELNKGLYFIKVSQNNLHKTVSVMID